MLVLYSSLLLLQPIQPLLPLRGGVYPSPNPLPQQCLGAVAGRLEGFGGRKKMNFRWVFVHFRCQVNIGIFSTRLKRDVFFWCLLFLLSLVLLKICLKICLLAPSIFEGCLGPFGHFNESDGLDLCFRRVNKVNIKVRIWAQAVSYRILQCF